MMNKQDFKLAKYSSPKVHHFECGLKMSLRFADIKFLSFNLYVPVTIEVYSVTQTNLGDYSGTLNQLSINSSGFRHITRFIFARVVVIINHLLLSMNKNYRTSSFTKCLAK